MTRSTFVQVAVGVLCLSVACEAAIIAYQDGETAGHRFDNWTLNPGGGDRSLSVNAPGNDGVVVGSHNNAGRIGANMEGGFPTLDLVYTTAGSMIGNYNTMGVLSMSLDVYSYASRAAGAMRLYMQASGFAWYYDIGTVAAGWQTINANMLELTEPGPFPGWYNEGGRGITDFHADIANVQRVGFELNYQTLNGQMYGFDNLELNNEFFVPEPQTFVVLGFALLSLGVVFRRQYHTLVGVKVTTVR
jgi:hypothetical protein